MADNLIQIGVTVDIKDLQASLQQGASVVQEQTDGMAKQFKKLAKESKTAIDDVEKAAKLSGLQISDEMTSVLEQVPKLASGLADAFSGGGVGAFVGVLLQAGIALKGLYDDVIALKGAKEAWAELDKKFAASEDTLQAKMRQDIIEHIRLTQGSAAAAQAAIRMADKELVPLSKDIEQILSGKNAGELSEGLRKDLEGIQHISFGELPRKINEIHEAIGRADENTKKLNDRFLKFAALAPALGDVGRIISGYLGAAVERAEGERQRLATLGKGLENEESEYEKDVANQKIAAAHMAAQEQVQAFQEGLQKRKDALDAFHTMSKQAEVRYWDDIIATGKAKGESLKEVQRLRWEAQKQAQQQALADEVTRVEEDAALAKAGSQQRIAILDAEIRKMKSLHQDETAEYKRLLKECETAQEEFDRKTLRDEIEQTQEKVAETKAGSKERVEILDAEIQKLQSENKVDTEEYKRLLKQRTQADREYQNAVAALQKAAEKEEQQVKAIGLQSAAQHEQALKGMAQTRLEFERQIGHISEAQYEERLRTEIKATYKAALDELEAKKALYRRGSVEYAKVEAEIVKLTDKYNADIEKSEQKSLLRRRQLFDQYFKHISGGFNSALNSWMQGTETASQAFGKMFQGILSQLVNFVEQWIEKRVEMWLMDELAGRQAQDSQVRQHVQADVAQIQADANLAAANAYVEWAAYPPIAEAMASLAYASVMKYAVAATAGAARFELGGIVPQTGLALVHQGERILPASMSGRGLGAPGGITVVVNHSVNAVDAESFQGTIRKHGTMIGNEVARVLRRKGFSHA